MSKQTKPLPRFKTEADERAFWEAKLSSRPRDFRVNWMG